MASNIIESPHETSEPRPPSREAVAQVFGRPPIYDSIFAHCTAVSLARLASTGSDARDASSDYGRRAFNINKRLKRFVDDPAAFRSLMARTGMIISGSFALQFFDRTLYEESDLDCYVYFDRSIFQVGAYLMGIGYVYKPSKHQVEDQAFEEDVAARFLANYIRFDPSDVPQWPNGVRPKGHRLPQDIDECEYGDGTVGTYTFERRTGNGATRKVQIVISRNAPFEAILGFHSTCVMNVITYNVAYALYPVATFEHRHAVELATKEGPYTNESPATRQALAKYAERGWKILPNVMNRLDPVPYHAWVDPRKHTPTSHTQGYSLDTNRWVCDEKSWKVRFDMTDVVPPPAMSRSKTAIRWDPTSECGWKLDSLEYDGIVFCSFENLNLGALRWEYTVPSMDHANAIEHFVSSRAARANYAKEPHRSWTRRACKNKNKRDYPLNSRQWKWWDSQMPMLRRLLRDFAEGSDYNDPFNLGNWDNGCSWGSWDEPEFW